MILILPKLSDSPYLKLSGLDQVNLLMLNQISSKRTYFLALNGHFHGQKWGYKEAQPPFSSYPGGCATHDLECNVC